jgi:hypothetical protein
MAYFDDSQQLTVGESTTLDGLSAGSVPVKTAMGFAAATQDNVPSGTTNKAYDPTSVTIAGGTIGAQTVANVAAAAADRATGARGASRTRAAFGADGVTWDLTGLACDTKGGFRLFLHLVHKGNPGAEDVGALRLNGSTTSNISGQATETVNTSNYAGPVPATYSTCRLWGYTFLTRTTVLDVDIYCPAPESGNSRTLYVTVTTYNASTIDVTRYVLRLASAAGELVSVGAQLTTTGSLVYDGASSYYIFERQLNGF